MRRKFAPLLWLGIAAGLVVVLVIAAWLYVTREFDSPGPLREAKIVVLEEGLGAWAIADRLAEEGVVYDANVFAVGTWLEGRDKSLKAGEYEFEALASPRDVLAALTTGGTLIRRLTVPEGLTSAQVIERLAAAEGLTGEIEAIPPTGSLLPETYHYSHGVARAALVQQMEEGMKAALEELWPARDPDILIETPEEALVLASIVEKETSVAEERALVAGVFMNRLRKKMRLQSDPTVIYAVTDGTMKLGRRLTRADLKTESPYNTYIHKGLPPKPIANPGRDAIAAVLNPAKTDALFFVADGSGGHAFAETLEEHNRNVARWRKIRSEQ